MDNIREVIARAIYGCGWNIEKWSESEMQDAFLLRADAVLSAIEAAGMRIVEYKTIAEAHAVMRECGWQLAPGSDNVSGDGVLEVAAAEIEDKFRAMLAATHQE